MKKFIISVFIFYSSFSYSESSLHDSVFLNKRTQLLDTLIAVHFPDSLSSSKHKSLQKLIAALPRELLQVKFVIDTDEIAIDSHQRVETDYSIRNHALHIILHQYDEQTGVSHSKQWRKLSGWKRDWFGLSLTANNQDGRAYAEMKGMKNPTEDFITTAQQFISPPNTSVENSIKCRMPLKYDFVRTLFHQYDSPLDIDYVRCRTQTSGMLDDVVFIDPNNGAEINLGPINEDTVLGFELLYATPGTGDASEIAGHLLLRVKLNNNPQAKAQGVENPHDLVISFLANTLAGENVEKTPTPRVKTECRKNWMDTAGESTGGFDALKSIIQSIKGLSGGYLTMMDRQTLAETIKNYTIEEDRDLLRYELDLNSVQKDQLLDQLYRAKKNYNASYYFFNQNCASVLVKVIGMGIKSEVISEFSPLVSPPNSLVALFIREGLARPVRPAFYSYRKKSFIAQDLIRQHYVKISQKNTARYWPAINMLFSPLEKNRTRLVEQLGDNIGHNPDLDSELYQLFGLIQEAEMAFAFKDLVCEQYTSETTAKVRAYQRLLLANSPAGFASNVSNVDLSHPYVDSSEQSYRKGVPHTKLLAYSLASGYLRTSESSTAVLSLAATLDEQEFGSISNIAMQRSSYVKLASAQMNLSLESQQRGEVQSWRFTSLEVRKFKDRLDRVPQYFSFGGSMGLGLSLLEFEQNVPLGIKHTNWLGGELLFNLFSGAHNDNYLYVSVGADIRQHKKAGVRRDGIALPVRVESLLTFGSSRRWQWRNNGEFRHALAQKFEDEFEISTGLVYKVGEVAGQLLLIRFSSVYQKFGENDISHLSWLGVELNPF